MTPDEIRKTALDSVEQQERLYRWSFLGGTLMEVLFMILFFQIMDLHNKIHVLIFVSTVSSYTIIIMGLVALGALSNRNAQRVIRAIEATAARAPLSPSS